MNEIIPYPVSNKEGWRPIVGFEEYFVSSYGRVISTKTGKILKPALNHKSYQIVALYKAGKCYSRRVHRLVAETFIPNPDNLREVDHINNIRDDNKAENLRWATASENTRNREYCRQATSKYNGVMLKEKNGKWQANIYLDGKTKHLGIFTEEKLAAKAFNDFCIENNLNRELNVL